MADVDQPAGGWECSQSPAEELRVSTDVSLITLYTDSSKSQTGCKFPSSGLSVWFGSYFSGVASELKHWQWDWCRWAVARL
jgi:hypothetical protein